VELLPALATSFLDVAHYPYRAVTAFVQKVQMQSSRSQQGVIQSAWYNSQQKEHAGCRLNHTLSTEGVMQVSDGRREI